MLYAIKTPNGELLDKTVALHQSECWRLMQYECRKFLPQKLRKEISAFTAWQARERNILLRKHGFTCVRVNVVECA